MATRARRDHMTGDLPLARGRFTEADGQKWYRIDDYDTLDPFLVNVVTPGDQWIFVSTSGALTAGRWSAELSLFPYETDDRLHRSDGRTGPLTVIRVSEAQDVWQPFAASTPFGVVERSVAKTAYGDRLRFTERHLAHGLTFTYTWMAAGRFGLVRSCELILHAGRPPIDVDVLDGLVNVLPAGVELSTQQRASTLVDGYRRTELDAESGLALFTLEAMVSDRADPAEALRANTIWSEGLPDPTVALSERQVRRFRSGSPLEPEHLVTGQKGAYLAAASARLDADRPLRWIVVADVGLDHCATAELRTWLLDTADDEGARWGHVQAQADEAHRSLGEIVAAADGRQSTADQRVTVHHFANVLFNCMRGGVFLDDHRIEVPDVQRFVGRRNRAAQPRFASVVSALDDVVEIGELRRAVSADPDLVRLVNEYLPLTFSRRHGDPSRPWNKFRIPERGPDGHLVRGYEGNWRDIFQNWDALLHSFPNFIESVIAKFLNASTLDGNNPYRITHDGIDWEVPEDDSWGHFGYWGDHQIVYLHRLLLAARRFHPGLLESGLGVSAYSYADVPYRMHPYERLVADPKHTLEFDHERQAIIEERVAALGTDGKLIPTADGTVHLASLAEKLMVPALAKLSNLVADAGIWLNTQRPEWNDANNALVGNGVSVVTLFHLRDYLAFVDSLLSGSAVVQVPVGRAVLEWMQGLEQALSEQADFADGSEDVTSPKRRRELLDALGTAYSDYRTATYGRGPGEAVLVPLADVRRFLAVAKPHLDRAARCARRDDGLVHTYWLLRLEPGKAHLEPLYEMLEGQVALLSSGDTRAPQVVSTVDAMFAADLYRPDQDSFILYPNRLPPSFLEKNRLPSAMTTPVVDRLATADVGIVCRDVDGALHFDPSLESADHLAGRLDALEADPALGPLVRENRADILDAFEQVFRHRSFTGRSQTMHRYEGLGSVYWHMVSKLLFAVQERLVAAVETDASDDVVSDLADRYHRIQHGLGYLKSAAVQGAFPTDPHSHTPAHTGAQQPGMTGQVKEGVLIRWGELGVRVDEGRLRFQPIVLDPAEFVDQPRPWEILGPDGVLEAGTLGFTYCDVPVVYHLVDEPGWTKVAWADGRTASFGVELDRDTSAALFSRTGSIERIDVGVQHSRLR